eukprot:3682205-Prymnesium_polylepis.2
MRAEGSIDVGCLGRIQMRDISLHGWSEHVHHLRHGPRLRDIFQGQDELKVSQHESSAPQHRVVHLTKPDRCAPRTVIRGAALLDLGVTPVCQPHQAADLHIVEICDVHPRK